MSIHLLWRSALSSLPQNKIHYSFFNFVHVQDKQKDSWTHKMPQHCLKIPDSPADANSNLIHPVSLEAGYFIFPYSIKAVVFAHESFKDA